MNFSSGEKFKTGPSKKIGLKKMTHPKIDQGADNILDPTRVIP